MNSFPRQLVGNVTKKTSVWFGIALLVIGARCPLTWGQTLVQQQGPAKIYLSGVEGKDVVQLRFADVLKVTVEVEGDKTLEVRTPDSITQSVGWKVLGATPAQTSVPKPGARARWRKTYDLEALAPDSLTLQVEPLSWREKGGVFSTVTFQPIAIQVRTTIDEPDLKKLRDPTQIERVPAASSWPWLPWAGAGLGTTAVLGLAAYLLRRRARAARAALTPEALALYELDRLERLRWPEKGRGERFVSLLSNVLRNYLEKKWNLPARRQTTPEFLRTLSSQWVLDEAQSKFLAEFLDQFDLAKFAGVEPAASFCDNLAKQVREFVRGQAPAGKN
ncbi:MAG: hypothetical protein L0Y72_32165 [Gemmataceae bacterium]|nr:hypothetical protein [Gemmataceae bacterium]MCI0743711.1 hypothetical protein [Gemmataceae bacterium]